MGWEPLGMGLQNARSNCAGMPGRPPVGMAQPLCADFTPCEGTRRAPAKCSGAAPGLARPGSGMGGKGTAQGVLMPHTQNEALPAYFSSSNRYVSEKKP